MEDNQLVSDVKRLAENLGQLPDPMARPPLIVVSGLPGTGKSYFCDKLAHKLGFVVLESDVLRKLLFSSPSYGSLESQRLFQASHRLIEELLKKGIPLVFDATNLSERHREYLYSIADRLGAKLVLVRVEAPPEVVHQRLQARVENANSGGSSDADWSVYQRMKSSVQQIQRRHYVVDTSRDITPVLEKIVKEAMR